MSNNVQMKQNMTEDELAIAESEFEKQSKSMMVFVLLWLFLGVLGGHRFYTGHTGYAITMLLLGWATFGIWPLIDGIVGMIKLNGMNEQIEYDILQHIKMSNMQSK